jgi:hypothetical protein
VPPASNLAEHVELFWINEVQDSALLDIVPDGCIDIYWTGIELRVAGPNTRPLTITAERAATFVGVRFRPGVAGQWLRTSATEFLNQHPPLSSVGVSHSIARITDQLAVAKNAVNAATALEGWLVERLSHVAAGQPVTDLVPDEPAAGVSMILRRYGIRVVQAHDRDVDFAGRVLTFESQ